MTIRLTIKHEDDGRDCKVRCIPLQNGETVDAFAVSIAAGGSCSFHIEGADGVTILEADD